MKKRTYLILLLIPIQTFAQEVIHLLPGNDLPKLTVYLPLKDNSKGTAVIICPGGAYAGRSDVTEGSEPAKKLNEAGITAFVLDYRLPNGVDTIPLNDAQAAIRYVRAHHQEFKIDVNRTGIMGYSAGGHLASTAGTHFKEQSERPDFMVLAYPVITMSAKLTHPGSRKKLLGEQPDTVKVQLYSNELQVTDNTPGTFITHAMDDATVPVQNSLYFQAALLQHYVPVQIFLYARGGHGWGINDGTVPVQWIGPCINWIKKEGWKIKN
jgi:acetyl esterase/lipase